MFLFIVFEARRQPFDYGTGIGGSPMRVMRRQFSGKRMGASVQYFIAEYGMEEGSVQIPRQA